MRWSTASNHTSSIAPSVRRSAIAPHPDAETWAQRSAPVEEIKTDFRGLGVYLALEEARQLAHDLVRATADAGVPADGRTLTTEEAAPETLRNQMLIARARELRMDAEVGNSVERTRMLGQLANALALREARLYDVLAYLAKTLDNIEGIESGWTAAEAREFIAEALAMGGAS